MLVAAGLSACTGSGQVTYSGEVQTPQLVEVSPGVQVIADYDQPVFFSDQYYWRYDNGVWYRSREHTRGWARVEVVPPQIRTIDRPEIYVHYHGQAQATVEHHDNVEVRDQRQEIPTPPPTTEYTPPPAPEAAPPATTHVDVRENHDVQERHDVVEHRDVSPRDVHKDAKEQRKDDKEKRKDAKEQRKEDKERRKEEKHD
jgi:hypothetical protein